MSNPPTNISASQLWLKLSSQERPSKIVDFPRKGPDGEPLGRLRIRILTQEEQMAATVAAENFVREHLKEAKKDEIGYERLYTDAVIVEVLFRACRDEEDEKRAAFPSPKKLRQALTTEEIGALFRHYMTVQLELGPTVSSMSEEECEAWITRLAEGGSAFPFDLLDSDFQRVLLLHMAFRLRSSPTGSGSAGSPLDEIETRSSSEDSLSE